MILTRYKTYYINRNMSNNNCKLMLQNVDYNDQQGPIVPGRLTRPAMVIENFGTWDSTRSSVFVVNDRSEAQLNGNDYTLSIAVLEAKESGSYGLDIGDKVPAIVLKYWEGSWQYEIYYLGGSGFLKSTQYDKFNEIYSLELNLLATAQGLNKNYYTDSEFTVMFTDDVNNISELTVALNHMHEGEDTTITGVQFDFYRTAPTYAEDVTFVDLSGVTNVGYGKVRNSTAENIIFENIPKINYFTANNDEGIKHMIKGVYDVVSELTVDVDNLDEQVKRLESDSTSAFISR